MMEYCAVLQTIVVIFADGASALVFVPEKVIIFLFFYLMDFEEKRNRNRQCIYFLFFFKSKYWAEWIPLAANSFAVCGSLNSKHFLVAVGLEE